MEEYSSMIGAYGQWASDLTADPPGLSFRSTRYGGGEIEAWRRQALQKTIELIAAPAISEPPQVAVMASFDRDGLRIDELEWSLPYGPPTKAVFLRPSETPGRLPGVLGLHDHSAKKYFGWEKIAEGRDPLHPILVEHRARSYGGASWANELARRGFAVLVHDVFPFGSRRIREADVPREIRHDPAGREPTTIEEIIEYDRWSAAQETVVAKSLFCAGTTWPGVYLSEDRFALEYLSSRDEVDPGRIGCCGLSGGGMRTAYLAGIDHRVKAAVCVGFMTTWTDFLLHKSHTHTWMAYTPLLPRFLDFPEVAALRVPLPLFVQNNEEDELFTLPEMRRAAGILDTIYRKAGAVGNLGVGFYPGRHKFDRTMQGDAFGWLEGWLSE